MSIVRGLPKEAPDDVRDHHGPRLSANRGAAHHHEPQERKPEETDGAAFDEVCEGLGVEFCRIVVELETAHGSGPDAER